ncbi:MAG: DUF1640 domain-containing protein [Acetobacteraceae bacterium]|nr:DUF1640 domain-containing protein [Acetobacteraceae bacterium]
MSAIPFDTLKFARHLEASGLSASVAAGASEALADALTGADLATKGDITDVRREITDAKREIAAEFADTRREIAAVKTELKGGIELLRRDITIKFGSMLVIAVGILLTAFRYLPPHP